MTWTKQKHDEARARCEAATDGPWEQGLNPLIVIQGSECDSPYFETECAEDTKFVAHSRIDLEDALDEIERLNGSLVNAETARLRVEELGIAEHDSMLVEIDHLGELVIRQAEELLRCAICSELKEEHQVQPTCDECNQTMELQAEIGRLKARLVEVENPEGCPSYPEPCSCGRLHEVSA